MVNNPMITKIIVTIIILGIFTVSVLPVAEATISKHATHNFTQVCWTGNVVFSGDITATTSFSAKPNGGYLMSTFYTIQYPSLLSHCYFDANAPELDSISMSVYKDGTAICRLHFTQFDTTQPCHIGHINNDSTFKVKGIVEYHNGIMLPPLTYPFDLNLT